MCILRYSEITKTHGTTHIVVSACFIDCFNAFWGRTINNQERIIKQMYDYSDNDNNNNNNNNNNNDDDDDDDFIIIIKEKLRIPERASANGTLDPCKQPP